MLLAAKVETFLTKSAILTNIYKFLGVKLVLIYGNYGIFTFMNTP